MRSYDVVIVGGGIAGAFLARHLKIDKPELSVLLLESHEKIDDFKVGESTVEVAAHYMIKRLNLGAYLYQHHLPKNGLRFFFDSEQKNLPLEEMSEIGSDHFPFYPSFQLERAKLERDLVGLNRAVGVEVLLGAKATAVTIDSSTQHTIVYEREGKTETVMCRWIGDASGRRHFLPRALGKKIHKETRLNTAAAWARYENVAGLDAVESADPNWKGRIKYSSRHLSTNHLMYDGYWIWFIPLAGDLMSVGVVYDKDRFDKLGLDEASPRKQEGFEAFLKSHRAAGDLLKNAKLVDFQAFAHIPYFTDEYFSKDRYVLTGEAGAFTDPFYSPGSDFIATANEFAVSLIAAEMKGDPQFHDRVSAFNAYYKFKYESTIRLYANLYPAFGSFEIFKLKFLLDFNNYYNTVFWPFLAGAITNLKWVQEELRLADRILRAQDAMSAELVRFADALRSRAEYFGKNKHQFHNGLAGVSELEKKLGMELDDDFRRDEVQRVYGHVLAALFENILREPGLGSRKSILAELNLTSMFAFKEVTEESLGKLLVRVGMRLASELKKEFPEAGIEKVTLSRSNGEPSTPSVFGAQGARLENVEARARELWDARGNSIVHLRI
ncbi:MAG: NAD(P)/FAD-dependent oxidoreductase [Polyangiaceae bacterium]